MGVDQRTTVRRGSDQLLMETMRVHRILLSLLHGKGGNMAMALSRLHQMGIDLGRREEDRRLGQAFTEGLSGIAGRLLELGIIDQLPRKIRLTKILGKTNGEFPVGIEKIGWEMNLPKVGERYCLYLDDGRVFRTGEVAECRVDHFRTGSSVYRVEVLDESPAALASAGGKSVAPEGTGFSSE